MRISDWSSDVCSSDLVTLCNGTRIVQPLADRSLLAEGARHGRTLTYDRLIIACGAREHWLPFPGWTLPGVTGAGGLQALIKGGTPVDGQRIVVAGSGPLLWAAAATAQARGAHILAIVEQAPTQAIARFAGGLAHTPAKLAHALRLRFGLWTTPYWHGAHVTALHCAKQVTGITDRQTVG